jgi:IgGFc binding protein/Secretion system C-terminal sorting domain
VFQLQSYENLTGSRVRSLDPSKKLAVFAGARQANVKCSGADDHLYDQNFMGSFGTEFVTVPFSGQGGDVFNIVSLEDSNSVFINFGSAINLGKGVFIDTLLTSASYIVSSKPIAIAQYNKSQACNNSQLGDPNMVMLVPVNLMKQNALFRNIDYDPNGPGAFSAYYVNIVVPASGTGAVFLDGQQVTGFQSLSSNGAYSWKQLQVSPGSHQLTAAGGMNSLTYALGSFNSYAYHLGFDVNNSPTWINELTPSGTQHNITVSPNPVTASSIISITGLSPQSQSLLRIFNTAGQLVSEKSFSGNQVPLKNTDLASGIYHFTIESSGYFIGSGKFGVK